MYFLSQNVLPVTIYDSLDDAPFSSRCRSACLRQGTYQLQFYAIDTSGTRKRRNTVTLVLPGPGCTGICFFHGAFAAHLQSGRRVSVRPEPRLSDSRRRRSECRQRADRYFCRCGGWATISNAPSSPTAATSASLNIGGQNVDFYMYQLNGGSWSAEAPVSHRWRFGDCPRA